jgi:hypothetical protein
MGATFALRQSGAIAGTCPRMAPYVVGGVALSPALLLTKNTCQKYLIAIFFMILYGRIVFFTILRSVCKTSLNQ